MYNISTKGTAISGYKPSNVMLKNNRQFCGPGGYFFLCSRIKIVNSAMPMMTSENVNKFSYVTYCI
ncbi:MAG: hypothetical protein ACI4SB_00740 [Acutalibacteraceae bacterium]